ncbi:MAG: gliding motility-associated C-terminal domain-containing protein [Cyclobacterium sp.]|uniref:T9SS type B sorting domain-containing protein n=1 Tax=Cyclobacterium sp. TaxID=1966343 RepID=UPI0039710C4B
MIGNTNMTLLDYEEDLMNDGMMVFVDVDADPETVNSSSATLDFSDENGCVATYEEYLEITDFFIRVPTAFSPNGNDSNDYFFPVFSDLNNIQFWVFNRWGELLYFTADVNSRGWDGRHKGIEMPVGNYLYKLIYTDKKGVENQKTGPFSLVK